MRPALCTPHLVRRPLDARARHPLHTLCCLYDCAHAHIHSHARARTHRHRVCAAA